jgi:hypothetical protein
MIRDGLSGALAVSLALGIAELAAAMTAAVPPVIAVGDQLIDYAPGWLTHLVIDILGQSDKPALILAIALATLAAGAAIGVSARPAPARAAAGFAALGLAGGVASALDTPASSPQGAFVAALGPILGAAVGWQSLRLLMRAGTAEDPGPREVQAQPIVRRAPGRRAFLGFATAAAGASATSFIVGRQIAGSSVDVEGQRESIALPDVPQCVSTPLRSEATRMSAATAACSSLTRIAASSLAICPRRAAPSTRTNSPLASCSAVGSSAIVRATAPSPPAAPLRRRSA